MPAEVTLAQLLIGGAAVAGAVSSVQQGRANAAIAEANAEIIAQQAKAKVERLTVAGREEQKIRLEERRRILARNRAKFGKSGVVFEGSPLLAQQKAAENLTNDAAMANFNIQTEIQATKIRGVSAARITKFEGRVAKRAGVLRAGQALFSGATQIAVIKEQKELLKNA